MLFFGRGGGSEKFAAGPSRPELDSEIRPAQRPARLFLEPAVFSTLRIPQAGLASRWNIVSTSYIKLIKQVSKMMDIPTAVRQRKLYKRPHMQRRYFLTSPSGDDINTQ